MRFAAKLAFTALWAKKMVRDLTIPDQAACLMVGA